VCYAVIKKNICLNSGPCKNENKIKLTQHWLKNFFRPENCICCSYTTQKDILKIVFKYQFSKILSSVKDPKLLISDPDPTLQFITNPDQTFQIKSDMDLTFHLISDPRILFTSDVFF